MPRSDSPGVSAILLVAWPPRLSWHPARSLGVLRRVHNHVVASSDAEYRALRLDDIGRRAYPGRALTDPDRNALATFGTGDIQRAKRFMEHQSKLGGYDAARALWCDLVYIWDPGYSRDLAGKLLADLKASGSPARACIAGAAAAPAFAYEALVPNLEVAQRAEDLFDAALELAETTSLGTDGALAAAGLAAVSASVDPVRCARAVIVARRSLLAIPEDAARDGLAQPVCARVAVASPQTALEIAASVKDPARRVEARLSAAEGMMFSVAQMRDGWRRQLGEVPLGVTLDTYGSGDE